MVGHARRKLQAARILLSGGAPADAASRCYYAAFHAVSAVLLARGLAYSSHSQVLGAFNRDLVRPGHFPPEFTTILTRLFEDRQTGDYDPTPGLGPDEASRDLADAERVVDEIERYLQG